MDNEKIARQKASSRPPKMPLASKHRIMDNNLFDSALKMPPGERVVFAELILASIDHEEEEVRKRIEGVSQGKAELLDFE